jgi:hypothetical protein
MCIGATGSITANPANAKVVIASRAGIPGSRHGGPAGFAIRTASP